MSCNCVRSYHGFHHPACEAIQTHGILDHAVPRLSQGPSRPAELLQVTVDDVAADDRDFELAFETAMTSDAYDWAEDDRSYCRMGEHRPLLAIQGRNDAFAASNRLTKAIVAEICGEIP